MITLGIIIVITFFGAIICGGNYIKCDESNKKKGTLFLIFTLVCLVLFIISVVAMVNADSTSVGYSERVALIYNDQPGSSQNKTLFYDKTNGEYFVVEYNPWDIIHLSQRRTIDKDTALLYIEMYDKLHEIDIN